MAAQSPPRFLLTRPGAQSLRLARALRARFGGDAKIIISPVIEPVFLCLTLNDGAFDALVFTSATGVAAYACLDKTALPRRAFCVGDRTAAAARAAGLIAGSSAGTADDLVRDLTVQAQRMRLLHLCGTISRGALATRLDAVGIELVTRPVYDQIHRPMTPDARRLLATNGSVILPLYSPRSAMLLSQDALDGEVHAAICATVLSDAVAECVDPGLGARIFVANRPDEPAMFEAIADALAARTGP